MNNKKRIRKGSESHIKALNDLDEGIEDYHLPLEPPKGKIEEPIAETFEPVETVAEPDGNGYEPKAQGETAAQVLHKMGARKADLDMLIGKIADPQGEEKLRLSRIKPGMTRRMIYMDMQQHLSNLLLHRNDKDFKPESTLKKLQYSIAMWSVAESGKGVDWLQQLVANFPQQTDSANSGGKDIYG
jgi:hypothetical protein